MASYAGLDVSLEETEVCIVDAAGAVVKETKVASEPEALLGFFERLDLEMERIGLEACSLTAWSFSIWLEDGWLFDGGAIGEPKENQPVFDSGAFEQKIAEAFPAYFNVDDTDIKFDNKSRNSGPEPDGVAIGRVSGRTYAFVVLDREGGVMVYDVSDPYSARFVEYVNTRNLPPDRNDATDPKTASTEGEVPTGPCLETGDLGPEGVLFIGDAESPNHTPVLVVTNQTSGTTAFYLLRKH